MLGFGDVDGVRLRKTLWRGHAKFDLAGFIGRTVESSIVLGRFGRINVG